LSASVFVGLALLVGFIAGMAVASYYIAIATKDPDLEEIDKYERQIMREDLEQDAFGR
jgi:hypothetical protein